MNEIWGLTYTVFFIKTYFMYSNTTLYYLNQMGIRPWIKRSSTISVLEDERAVKQEALKLLVFISSTLSIKAQSLLSQMMAYLNLPEQELSIIPVQERDSLNKYNAKIEQKTPRAILVLGLERHQFVTNTNLSCPVLNSIDPDYLITNPAEKGTVFKALHSLKQLLS